MPLNSKPAANIMLWLRRIILAKQQSLQCLDFRFCMVGTPIDKALLLTGRSIGRAVIACQGKIFRRLVDYASKSCIYSNKLILLTTGSYTHQPDEPKMRRLGENPSGILSSDRALLPVFKVLMACRSPLHRLPEAPGLRPRVAATPPLSGGYLRPRIPETPDHGRALEHSGRNPSDRRD
jgi:hypothetical protein